MKQGKGQQSFVKRTYWLEQIPFSNSKRDACTHGHQQSQYQNQNDFILCSRRWKSSIQSAETRLGADCSSNHEFLIAKCRLKLKKVETTTRPFKYDLNQISYEYIVKVTNRFQGLDMIECLRNYGQRFIRLYRRQ